VNGEDQELAYWRQLAQQYRREIDALRARLLQLAESAPQLFTGDLAEWMKDIDRIESHAELRPADVVTALDDLWKRAGDSR